MEDKTERFEMRAPASFLRVVDDWRRKHPELPSRAEAIRQLVEMALKMDVKTLQELNEAKSHASKAKKLAAELGLKVKK